MKAFASINQVLTALEGLSEDLDAAKKAAVADGDHIKLIIFFKQVSDLYDRFGDLKKKYNAIYDDLSKEHVPEAMRAAGVKSVRVEGVGNVVISHRYSCTMPDKELGVKWLKDNGHSDIVQETVNAQTLSAFAKNLLEDQGTELPEDIFKVGTSPYTSIRK